MFSVISTLSSSPPILGAVCAKNRSATKSVPKDEMVITRLPQFTPTGVLERHFRGIIIIGSTTCSRDRVRQGAPYFLHQVFFFVRCECGSQRQQMGMKRFHLRRKAEQKNHLRSEDRGTSFRLPHLACVKTGNPRGVPKMPHTADTCATGRRDNPGYPPSKGLLGCHFLHQAGRHPESWLLCPNSATAPVVALTGSLAADGLS